MFSMCAPNLLHVLESQILGYQNLCSPEHLITLSKVVEFIFNFFQITLALQFLFYPQISFLVDLK